MGQALKVCENCEFRVEKTDINERENNVCILTNKNIGLFWVCSKFRLKNGEHITC